MSKVDEAYWGYVNWCLRIGIPPLSPIQYEKVVASLPNQGPNNIDAIMRNNNRNKDK